MKGGHNPCSKIRVLTNINVRDASTLFFLRDALDMGIKLHEYVGLLPYDKKRYETQMKQQVRK